jgi:DNA-binding MarR family transcriptional regulator
VATPLERRALAHLAAQPGSSSEQVRAALSVRHASQVSRLLARLQREGLVVRAPRRAPGQRNAWRVTPLGERARDRDPPPRGGPHPALADSAAGWLTGPVEPARRAATAMRAR